MSARGNIVSLVAAATLSACSPVRQATTRPDYDTVDRTRTLRLVAVTTPLPAGLERVGDLWAGIARKWANQHRDFLVVEDFGAAEMPADLCSEGVQGILHLKPTARLADDGAEVEVIARLLRCEDQVEVWVASAGGAWRSEDDDLTEIKRYWARVLGPEVEPWVVPTYRLLTATLETMPSPALPSEAWVREKIELGD